MKKRSIILVRLRPWRIVILYIKLFSNSTMLENNEVFCISIEEIYLRISLTASNASRKLLSRYGVS